MWRRLIDDFRRYQEEVRGMSAGSVSLYARHVHSFVRFARRRRVAAAKQLRPGLVDAFLEREGRRVSRVTLQGIAWSLRSFLRFLAVRGIVSESSWRWPMPGPCFKLARLPRYLDRKVLRRVAEQFDRRRLIGKRDYAMFMLMVGLGLRLGEVQRLRLPDYEESRREILVRRSKSGVVEKLPVPPEVAWALYAYIRARPKAAPPQHLFVHVMRPFRGLSSPYGISYGIRRALRRVGVARGACHILRHSFAQHLIDHGAPVETIRELLGHHRLTTTLIYSKVSLRALREVAENDANDV